jgi:hypothetical protein
MLVASISFFNELDTEKRNYAHGFVEIMVLERIILWKGTMSMDNTCSWPPGDLHWMEGNHSRRNTC